MKQNCKALFFLNILGFFFKGRNLVIGIVYWLNGLFWVYAECWWICTVWALKSTFWQSRRMFNTWIQHQTVAETSSFILYLYAWHFVWVPAFVSFLCLPTVLYWRTDSTVESILELRPSHKRPYLSFAVFLFLWCALNFLCIWTKPNVDSRGIYSQKTLLLRLLKCLVCCFAFTTITYLRRYWAEHHLQLRWRCWRSNIVSLVGKLL